MSSTFEEHIEILPFELQNSPEWAKRRNDILASLRKDAEGLPMTTSQNLIIERLATFYAITRKREAEPDSKLSVSDIRQNNSQWLSMTAELHKQMTVGEDKRRHAMLETIMKIVSNAIILIEDDRNREDVRKRLQADFAEAGL